MEVNRVPGLLVCPLNVISRHSSTLMCHLLKPDSAVTIAFQSLLAISRGAILSLTLTFKFCVIHSPQSPMCCFPALVAPGTGYTLVYQ